MALGWILIGGFIALVLLLLAKDEYYDRQEQKKRMEMRAEIAWPVVIKTDRDSCEGRTVNVSASGALLCFTPRLSLMEIVTLTIRPPVRAALEITAEVVRTNIPCDNDDSTRRGAAVRFIIISEKDREFVSFSVFDHLQQKARSNQRRERDLRL
ncbi:MAG: PilZ domain-containing protein [Deltaproteobacteria bacterium]|jgi:hypothetical protein|nr:PilZ domain-containing protein [Deltaproteobacteria bacterium]PNV84976.1 MAG: hypothetical protein C0610_14200 [Desulfobacteraceae bacterium]MDH3775321.1 PilZ domain-containing protein [Deltaproteobacteria bacterium]MDH3802019.1 PilZ domain-containing protein [Deltaproteobacteria bacterium]MDH3849527.1 PilZ domain-containing protein [Deltaproteobacteria bacterium]